MRLDETCSKLIAVALPFRRSRDLLGEWRLDYTDARDVLSLALFPGAIAELGEIFQNIEPGLSMDEFKAANVVELLPRGSAILNGLGMRSAGAQPSFVLYFLSSRPENRMLMARLAHALAVHMLLCVGSSVPRPGGVQCSKRNEAKPRLHGPFCSTRGRHPVRVPASTARSLASAGTDRATA
eukprot:2086604-Pleurochrysis_carterae.AAC.1